ncbi:Extracellular solute-binding protein family 5 precursor (putative dipeptide ABC transporter) [Candidatus Glomeribacter gigasporarum BEG34]|uniref:Extracellular solute-binding protein family 5 (Putative dipeptide ABC transporter) n=1 Tax=Candidatus Glomeribacter gigasporarum BEG34 TaxID=1070319 RepID=G2J8M2_9BURK|nr:ABC transporter substrate-binding protein [Candidatus Glomeribacter gigasporarum]CCD29119.1 Extracellular solute-binding protein family 5 precursor (putative dipeptide ABC transporter) [Candidatus Glomeribacter gigasporarum BEG34]
MHTLSFFLKLAHFSAAAILTTAALIAPHRAQAGAFNGLSSLNAALAGKGRTLVYCSEGAPAGFDVAQYASSTDYTASGGTIYNQLVQYERGTTKLGPALAKRWKISPDGRVYTFILRHGVKFHTTPWFTPSREFNAKDVVFTFRRMLDPDMPFRKAYPSEFPGAEFFGFDNIEKVEAVGPPHSYTVRFTLKSASEPFLGSFAVPAASIYSAEYAGQLLKADKVPEIKQKPIGTGPFIFEKYLKDATIHFKGSPDDWTPEDVQLSRLVFAITPYAELKTHPHLQVIGGENRNFALNLLAYNVKHPPLDNVDMRRALDMVIDKKATIDAVHFGHAQAGVAPLPPMQWSLGCRAMRGSNFSQWCEGSKARAFNALLEQAVRTLDIGQRTALYLKAQKIFKSEQPYTAIAYPINYYVLNKNVTGFKGYMFGATVFYGVGLKK